MQLVDSPHWHVDRPPGSTIVRMHRSSLPITDLAQFEAGLADPEKVIPFAERARLALLVDLRDAPLRNDPEFEAVFQRQQRQLFGGFRRFALLVRTSVGKMQIGRQARTMGKAVTVFHDEASALAYLRTP